MLGNDQLKTHLRGPGKALRSRLSGLAYQEIWAWLTVPSPPSTPRSPAKRCPPADTEPAHARSNAPGTTNTASRIPANAQSPSTMDQPRS